MKAYVYLLKCLTNLHVGNGEVNFNIIDNEVERDPVTNYPTINSSGVKGALREYFEKCLDVETVNQLFGVSNSDQVDGKGRLKFLSANLLAQPIQNSKRKDSDKPYRLVMPNTAKDVFVELTRTFLGDDNLIEKLEKEHGIVSISDEDYASYDLPVLARNKLNNGISENLWYEEVVPHKSLFYMIVLADDEDFDLLDAFDNEVNNQVVQFGANASIGYGLCKLTRL